MKQYISILFLLFATVAVGQVGMSDTGSGGGSSADSTSAGNLLTETANEIDLGGTADQQTTLDIGIYNFNLNRTLGNFNVYGNDGANYGSFGASANNTQIIHYNTAATHSSKFRIDKDSAIVSWTIPTTSRFKLTPDTLFWNDAVKLEDYGAGANTGTETYLAGFDADGKIVEVDRNSIANQNLPDRQAFVGIEKVSFDTNDSIYVARNGTRTWIRSYFSAAEDILFETEERFFDNLSFIFRETKKISSGMANDVSSFYAASSFHVTDDDIAPIFTDNVGYIAGNHGLGVVNVNTSSHDKTTDDIGSVWTDGDSEYTIYEIDGNTLRVRPSSEGTGNDWAWDVTLQGSTLTHVSGATNTGDITFSSANVYQQHDYFKNHEIKYLVNGVSEIDNTFEGYVNYLDVVETYTITDPRTVTIANPTDWTTGNDWINVKIIYRFRDFGAVEILTQIETLGEISINYLGGLQFAKLPEGTETTSMYIPKLNSFVENSITYDFENIEDITSTPNEINFLKSDASSSANVPDRIYQIKNDATGNKEIGFVAGYNVEYNDTDSVYRSGAVTRFAQMTTSGKTYPRFVEGSEGINKFNILAYRQYFDYDNDSLTIHHNRQGGFNYLYINAHDTLTNYAVTLPSKFDGRNIQIIENDGLTLNQIFIDENLELSGKGQLIAKLIILKTGEGVVTATGTNDYIQKSTGTNSLGNSIIQENSGKIGIGVTPQEESLEVDGNGKFIGTSYSFTVDPENGGGPQLTLKYTPTDTEYFRMGSFGGSNTINSLFRDFRIIGDNGTHIYLDESTGNTGFGGNITPTYKVEIDTDRFGIQVNQNGSNGTSKRGFTHTSSGALGAGYNVGFRTFLDATGATNNYGFRGTVTGATNNYGVWMEAGLNYFSGNVGIGVLEPTVKLDIDGGTVKLRDYGSGTNTGTETYILSVDTDGDVIESDLATGLEWVAANRSYADDTAATTTGGLSSGNVYYNTTNNTYQILP